MIFPLIQSQYFVSVAILMGTNVGTCVKPIFFRKAIQVLILFTPGSLLVIHFPVNGCAKETIVPSKKMNDKKMGLLKIISHRYLKPKANPICIVLLEAVVPLASVCFKYW